jgi:uncharacterized protein (TIGR02996 family)
MDETIEYEFLRAIRAAPESDGPRLVFADWLDENGDADRAEFVRVQCALARLPADDPRRGELADRETGLRDAHGRAWAGPVRGLVEEYEFRRGFVEAVTLDARAFLSSADELFRLAPVRRVRLSGVQRVLGELVASPTLELVDELDLCGNELGDAGANAVAHCPHLGRLRALDLGFNFVSDNGVASLAGSRRLPELRSLRLNDNSRIGLDGVRALANSETLRLTSLDLSANAIDPECVRVLCASPLAGALEALEVHTNPVGDAGLELLLRSGLLARVLKRSHALDLHSMLLNPASAEALAGAALLDGVIQLNVSGNNFGNDGARALSESEHTGRLHSLSLAGNGVSDAGGIELLTSPFFGRLEVLDVSNNQFSDFVYGALSENFHSRATYNWRHQLDLSGNVPPDAPVVELQAGQALPGAPRPRRRRNRRRRRDALPPLPTVDFDEMYG